MENFKMCLPTFLAVVTTLMVIGIMCALTFFSIPQERVNLMQNVATMVVTQWVGVMGYFFGSSSGSAKKTDLLNEKKEEKQ